MISLKQLLLAGAVLTTVGATGVAINSQAHALSAPTPQAAATSQSTADTETNDDNGQKETANQPEKPDAKEPKESSSGTPDTDNVQENVQQ